MNLEHSEEQILLRATVRRYLEESAPIASYVRERLDSVHGTNADVWAGLVGLGLPGILISEGYAGAGLSLVDMGVVLEEMGRMLHPGPFLISALASTRLLASLAGSEERALWLPKLSSGESRFCLALHEEAKRGDLSKLDCHAERATSEGDASWRLTGVKTPVLDAMDCDHILVAARVNEAGELCVFVLPRESLGVRCEPVESLDGTRKLTRVRLEKARATRLGCGDARVEIARAARTTAVGLVADGVGAAERVLEMARDYALERIQFDQPIGAFQAVQHLLVDMLRDVELARAAVYYALWALDHEADAEAARAAALAKAFASEALPQVAARAIQIHGGAGFTWEMDPHLYYKRLISLQHLFGDAGEQLEAFADLQFGESES